MTQVSVLYLERAVVSLQLPAQTLQLAASQDGLAVLVPQVVFLLDQLVLLLLQRSHLLLCVTVLFQLAQKHKYFYEVFLKDELSHMLHWWLITDYMDVKMVKFIVLFGVINSVFYVVHFCCKTIYKCEWRGI